jgi:WD40 repeat protein
MARRLALLIGNSNYQDPNLAKLVAPSEDTRNLADVLRRPDVGLFDDVQLLHNASSEDIRLHIQDFFYDKKPDDLLLFYFSGHGVRDDQGRLYLAVQNTRTNRLLATAIGADFIRDAMNASRSKRLIIMLDCCHSGAFADGGKAAAGESVGTGPAFEGTGYGRFVLTATDATQYAWEGDKIIGQADNSLFTHFLIEGLNTGAADLDQDGNITLNEIYEYVYDRVVAATPKQTPGKWTYKQQGDVLIAKNPAPPIVKPVELPAEIRDALHSPLPSVRKAIVDDLVRILVGPNVALATSAREALMQLVDDDSKGVSIAAQAALAADAAKQLPVVKQQPRAEQEPLAKEQTKQAELAALERPAQASVEVKQLTEQEPESVRLQHAEAEQERATQETIETHHVQGDRRAPQDISVHESTMADRIVPESAQSHTVKRKQDRAAHKASLQLRTVRITVKNADRVQFLRKLTAPKTIRSIAFSPDGTLLAAGINTATSLVDNPVWLWQLSNNKRVHALGKTDSSCVAFSPDGVLVASAERDCTVRLWQVLDEQEVRTLKGPFGFTVSPGGLAFSPDGALVAVGFSDNTVRLWKVSDGKEMPALTGHANSVNDVDFSPDGILLASGSADNSVRLWRVSDGKEIRNLTGHGKYVLGVAFSPKGNLLASSSKDNTVRIWQVSDGKLARVLKGHTQQVNAVAFSPDGETLASASNDNAVKLWRVADGTLICTLTGHDKAVNSVAFSPDGSLLASGSGSYWMGGEGSVRLWGIST